MPTPTSPRRFAGLIVPLLCAILLGVACFLFAIRALNRPLNHDENQFLAPAALFENRRLLPYRDFPLFHLPNLVFVYAAAQRLTGDLILGPKLVCLTSTVGLLLLLSIFALQIPGRLADRALLALAVVLLLLCDPLFVYAAGKTWNHEVPAFLLLLAVYLQLRLEARLPVAAAALSGVCTGLATGCRLTYLIPAGAFALHFLTARSTWKARSRDLIFFSAGFATAMLPTAWCYAQAPEAFVFDNFRFPRLRLLDPENTRIQKTVTWPRKVRFLLKEVLSRSWILLAAAGALAAWGRRQRGAGERFVWALGLFSIVGCFAPSRYQYQHFYVLPPLLALGVLISLRERPMLLGSPAVRCGGVAAVLLALLGVTRRPPGAEDRREMGAAAYSGALDFVRPGEWFHARYARQQEPLRKRAGRQDETAPIALLTLAPAVALSAQAAIYPEFATGVFAWRSAQFVPREKRLPLHFVAPEDLEVLYDKALPPGILTGVEDSEEELPLVTFARRHGYREVPLQRQQILWLAPGQGSDGAPASGR